ncbi:MAG: HlyD family efflux transporter periplasmic adaptor subunit [Saprospiraceae bacterium]
MLNISPVNQNYESLTRKYDGIRQIEAKSTSPLFKRFLLMVSMILLALLFFPWTQNIRSNGMVTTLYPGQRPQKLQSVIAGRIEKWYIKEGDKVRKGDTILRISEVKEDYFDPQLLQRTADQLNAKQSAVGAYERKVTALDNQIGALLKSGQLRLQQANNRLRQSMLRVTTDSIDMKAQEAAFQVAAEQYARMEQLHKEGLRSLTDLEARKLTMQRAQASMIAAENKLLTSQNDLLNAKIELGSISAKYREDISKAESDKFSTLSNLYDAEATVTKMQNQFSNYTMRSGYYYVTAPQDGYVTEVLSAGVGENIKESTEIATIMPTEAQLAVSIYVKAIDLPLLDTGRKVRIQFDGWPAIVFSGWPGTSYGTYGGIIFAIDKFTDNNGKFRILVKPDPTDHPWPTALRVGSGAIGMCLLNNVPIWYELWRKINGFPPDFYYSLKSNEENKK